MPSSGKPTADTTIDRFLHSSHYLPWGMHVVSRLMLVDMPPTYIVSLFLTNVHRSCHWWQEVPHRMSRPEKLSMLFKQTQILDLPATSPLLWRHTQKAQHVSDILRHRFDWCIFENRAAQWLVCHKDKIITTLSFKTIPDVESSLQPVHTSEWNTTRQKYWCLLHPFPGTCCLGSNQDGSKPATAEKNSLWVQTFQVRKPHAPRNAKQDYPCDCPAIQTVAWVWNEKFQGYQCSNAQRWCLADGASILFNLTQPRVDSLLPQRTVWNLVFWGNLPCLLQNWKCTADLNDPRTTCLLLHQEKDMIKHIWNINWKWTASHQKHPWSDFLPCPCSVSQSLHPTTSKRSSEDCTWISGTCCDLANRHVWFLQECDEHWKPILTCRCFQLRFACTRVGN